MKKLLVLIIPFLFVACGEEKGDPTLNGYWKGEVKSTNTVTSVTTTETVIYKFEDNAMETHKAKETNSGDQIETEKGIYTLEDEGFMKFKIKAHSCTEDKIGLKSRALKYEVSEDQTTLTISTKNIAAKKIVLTKVDNEQEIESLQEGITAALDGCYIENANGTTSFKPQSVKEIDNP